MCILGLNQKAKEGKTLTKVEIILDELVDVASKLDFCLLLRKSCTFVINIKNPNLAYDCHIIRKILKAECSTYRMFHISRMFHLLICFFPYQKQS